MEYFGKALNLLGLNVVPCEFPFIVDARRRVASVALRTLCSQIQAVRK